VTAKLNPKVLTRYIAFTHHVIGRDETMRASVMH
jgi:hypothetical protein